MNPIYRHKDRYICEPGERRRPKQGDDEITTPIIVVLLAFLFFLGWQIWRTHDTNPAFLEVRGKLDAVLAGK